jgi:hypothetical protein
MKNAFVNADGVLTAWGYAESNGTDTKVAVPEDFALQPGAWRQVSGQWQPYAPVSPLAQAQAAQIALMAAAYQGAIAQNVTFTTAGGVSKAFQADPGSISNVQSMLAAYKTAVPTGFYWLAADNTQVAFTLADLQGLAKAMGDQGWSAFQRLQVAKASIAAAMTVAAAQAVVW